MYRSLESLSAVTGLPQKYLKVLAGKNVIPYLIVGGRLKFNEAEVSKALAKLADRKDKTLI